MGRVTVFLAVSFFLSFPHEIVAQGKPRNPASGRNTVESAELVSINGRVLFSRQFKPAERVRVKLVSVGGGLISTIFTDERGRFEFPNLTRGVYVVQVEEQGFLPAQERVDLYRGSRGDTVLMLEEPLKTDSKPGGVARSVRELQIPTDAQNEFDKGIVLLYEKDQPRRSLQHFLKSIEIYSDFDAAYVQAAVAHLRLNGLSAAETILGKGLDENNDYAPAHALQGTVYNAQGRHREAIATLQQAVALGPAGWQVEYELGKAHTKLQEFDPALEHSKRAYELKPDAAEPHLQLYNVRIHRKDYGEALVLLESFVRQYPEHAATAAMRRMEAELRGAAASAANRP